ncbi:hypothetical protein [Leucobacter chromiireducens]|uniref:hypothetical protein n=1 Tax=Leucobacter chromiireducens TaxID=283877 RepID=UPI000F637DDC|nr:hypothetical protein [Leucobacter chromiireducens]
MRARRDGERCARRALAASVAGAAILVVGVVPASLTEASWADTEAAAASFVALTVPTPQPLTVKCAFNPGLLGAAPKITVDWRVPAGTTGYTMASAEYGYLAQGGLTPLTAALLGSVTVSGTTSAAKTEFNLGLLGGLLGGGASVAVRLTGPGGWKSAWLVATGTSGLAGTNADCTWSTVAAS